MDGTAAITGTHFIPLEYVHIRKLNNDEQLLGENSASRDLITGAIDSHLNASLFYDVVGYEENYPIKIITFL